jgi:hypothetical protein
MKGIPFATEYKQANNIIVHGRLFPYVFLTNTAELTYFAHQIHPMEPRMPCQSGASAPPLMIRP